MANKHRGEVALQLDKKRKLKFNTHALVELEDALGMPFSKLNEETIGFGAIAKMFWASLLHEIPDLTLPEAHMLMDLAPFATISEKVMEAFSLAFPEANEEKKEKVVEIGAGKS